MDIHQKSSLQAAVKYGPTDKDGLDQAWNDIRNNHQPTTADLD
jgi:hypothetical protein